MRALYRRLAWDGIRKNKQLYFPYLLTGSVMVMIFYILYAMTDATWMASVRGSGWAVYVMQLGSFVIGGFSLLFLFYTNSFLVRQRYKEFGLYNVLGMDKRNISRVLFWENLYVALITLLCGFLLGIAMSKAAELALMNLLHQPIDYKIRLSPKAMVMTVLVYGGIFLLLLLNSLIRVRRAKPLELIKTASMGERMPRLLWVEALAGVVLLGYAYYLAVTIQEPLSALTWFFIAVLLVILATYALFLAGSVVLCKLLKKNKKYYYKANHFVSVSSMMFRMRRNGAGLASICILLTTVLVMLVSTASLYIGEEGSILARYPDGITVSSRFDSWQTMSDNSPILEEAVRQAAGDAPIHSYRSAQTSGLLTETGLYWDADTYRKEHGTLHSYDQLGTVIALPLEDYNRMMGTQETLEDGECLLYCSRLRYSWDSFALEGGPTLHVKKMLTKCFDIGSAVADITPTVVLITKDSQGFLTGATGMFQWVCGFDVPETDREQAIALKLSADLGKLGESIPGLQMSMVESREDNRSGFYELNGSLLFLGVMLSIVFLFAAVLIIYYKQLSEGYEDRSRFAIMRKVGMTRREIRASINSQMLTVFASPLLMAGLHLCFAFPFLWKILMLFGLLDKALVTWVALGCFLIFALAYALVYKLTSNTYYTIVSGAKAE